MRGRIEQCAKDVRAGQLKLPPKHMLGPALPWGNRCEHQQDSAVGETQPGYPPGGGHDMRSAKPVPSLMKPGAVATSRSTSMRPTAFDRRPLGPWQPDRTAIPSYRQMLSQAAGPADDDLADH